MTTPAVEGEERVAPLPAMQMLRQILAYRPERMGRAQRAIGPAELLPEWLALARETGVAVPPELLPEMLAFGEQYVDMRDVVAAAVGELGQWLAAMNPPWAYAAAPPADPAAAWAAGTTEVRLRILRHLRRTYPAAGLALLRSTWATATSDDRVAFLETLETGLSLDDEPFLEFVLDEPIVEPAPDDDRVIICGWPEPKEVRPTAVNLLSTLPGSRLVTRMFARLAPLLALREPPGERARIDLQLPAAKDDKELRRYSIAPWWVPERTMSMYDMLQVVPPSLWAAHWGRSYPDLLQAARDIGDDLVIDAWTASAIRVRDAKFAEARLRMPGGKGPSAGTPTVAKVIHPDRLEPLVLERVATHGLNTAAGLLFGARFPWSPVLTRAVLEEFPDNLPWAVRDPAEHKPEGLVALFGAPYMHPATAVAVLRERGDPYEGEWVDLLHLRHTLHQAFE
ncbi:MAG TPA: DUF5691 domain-containing protein [Longimicrobium sp.]|jgi:hypothetical protein|uniref:DUF5691 domain-containing protein n=1 Tax=Longimicrobium sp. TaxID=2029185 RepID=UPI002ED9C3A8